MSKVTAEIEGKVDLEVNVRRMITDLKRLVPGTKVQKMKLTLPIDLDDVTIEVIEQMEEVINELLRCLWDHRVALAKRNLADANRELSHPKEWPAGQSWGELGPSSQGTFLMDAAKEVGWRYRKVRSLQQEISDSWFRETENLEDEEP